MLKVSLKSAKPKQENSCNSGVAWFNALHSGEGSNSILPTFTCAIGDYDLKARITRDQIFLQAGYDRAEINGSFTKTQ